MGNEALTAVGGAGEALLCPGCGYDLRGMGEAGRCSECGLAVDGEVLRGSRVPWEHRRRIGWVRAYVKTVWWVTIGSKRLEGEGRRGHDWRAARGFRWINAAVLSTVLVVAGYVPFYAPQEVNFEPVTWGVWYWVWPRLWMMGPGYWRGLWAPLNVVALCWPVAGVCVIALAGYIVGAARYVFRAAPREGASGAIEMADYAMAPLVFTLAYPVAVGVAVGAWALEQRGEWLVAYPWAYPALGYVVQGLLWVVGGAVVLSVLRVGQWVARVRPCGVVRAIAAGAELVALWIVGAVVMLLVVPWCLGLLWIVVHSSL